MNNFKTILSTAVLVAMTGAVHAADITITGSNTGAGTVVADGTEYARFSSTNVLTGNNSGAISVIGVLGDTTASAITLGATAKSFVVSYSSTGTSANQSLTHVHDATGVGVAVPAAALQASSNANTGTVSATGTMTNMVLTAAAQDSMVYSVSATGSAGSQSITPDLIR